MYDRQRQECHRAGHVLEVAEPGNEKELKHTHAHTHTLTCRKVFCWLCFLVRGRRGPGERPARETL